MTGDLLPNAEKKTRFCLSLTRKADDVEMDLFLSTER